MRTTGWAVTLAVAASSACRSAPTLPPREAPEQAVARPIASSSAPAASSEPAQTDAARRVAITFDDLGVSRESSDPVVSREILNSLRAANAPVAVFANCQHLAPETLRSWQRAGATIGNHTQTHLSLESVDTSRAEAREAWLSDVKSCDDTLHSVLGERVRYFRYPYLRYGATEAERTLGAEFLRSLGYRIAHVTAATSEWLLAGYYDAALAENDRALAEEVSEAYVDHMQATLAEAHRWTWEKLGRDAAQITLLHVNALARDHLSEVLRVLAGEGWQFVSLEEALSDPMYTMADRYVGHCGCSWLAHIEPALEAGDDYFFGDAEQAITERFAGRVRRH